MIVFHRSVASTFHPDVVHDLVDRSKHVVVVVVVRPEVA